MVQILLLPLLQIFCKSHIVVGAKQQASSFSLQPFADRRNLLLIRLLFRKKVVESKHHQRVCIRQNSVINGKLVPCLIDSLEYRDRMSGRLTHHFLKRERGAVEQFQGPGNPLQEVLLVPFRSLVRWPRNSANLGHS